VFTGLIADLGRVEAVERSGDGATLRIATSLARELRDGDSIAVNGVCLTAVDVCARDPAAARAGAEAPGVDVSVEGPAARAREGRALATSAGAPGEFAAQAMRETLQRSTLGELAAGDDVNLELALRADGRLGGHIVQGHVDGVGSIREVRHEGFSRVLAIHIDAALSPYVVEKGSITLSGVSLTVSALRDDLLEVSLIPETLQRTTLGHLAAGDRVNVEVDILAKHVQRLLALAPQ
jgi:riboflavin synthase